MLQELERVGYKAKKARNMHIAVCMGDTGRNLTLPQPARGRLFFPIKGNSRLMRAAATDDEHCVKI